MGELVSGVGQILRARRLPLALATTVLALAVGKFYESQLGQNSSVASRAGICSPDISSSFHPLDTRGLSELTVANTQGILRSNDIRSLAMTPEGLLVGFSGGVPDAVIAVTPQGIEDCGSPNVRIQGHVNAIGQNPETGEIVVVTDRVKQTDRYGVYVYNPGTSEWKQYLEGDGLPADQGYNLAFKGQDTFIATYGGIVRLTDDQLYPVDTSKMVDSQDQRLTAVLPLSDDQILTGRMSRGIAILPSMQQLSAEATPDALDSDNVRDFALDSERGVVWVAADGGISRLDLNTGEWKKEYPPTNGAVRVEVDGFGRPWVSTYNKDNKSGGVYYLDGDEWKTFEIGGADSAYGVAFGKDGWTYPKSSMFVATDRGIVQGEVPYPLTSITEGGQPMLVDQELEKAGGVIGRLRFQYDKDYRPKDPNGAIGLTVVRAADGPVRIMSEELKPNPRFLFNDACPYFVEAGVKLYRWPVYDLGPSDLQRIYMGINQNTYQGMRVYEIQRKGEVLIGGFVGTRDMDPANIHPEQALKPCPANFPAGII